MPGFLVAGHKLLVNFLSQKVAMTVAQYHVLYRRPYTVKYELPGKFLLQQNIWLMNQITVWYFQLFGSQI